MFSFRFTLKKLSKILYLSFYFFLIFLDILTLFKIPKKNKKKNILLIKLDRFGDFILWNNHFNNILKYYENKNIYLICNRQLKTYLKKHYKKIIFITIDKYSFLFNLNYRIKKLLFLRNFFFYKVINFHRERDIYFSDCIVKNISANEKIGNKIDEKNIINFFSNKHYNRLIKTKKNSHETIFLNEFTNGLLENYFRNSNLIKFQKNKIYKKYKNCVLICYGGTDSKKNISLKKMLNSLNISNRKTKIVLLGNKNEIGEFNKQYDLYYKNIIDLSGKTSFDDFIYLHYLAKLVISNDSASGHLAHYFNKHSYTFLGGGHFERFFPYPNKQINKHKYIYKKLKCFNCNWNCIYDNLNLKSYPCIENINNLNIKIKV